MDVPETPPIDAPHCSQKIRPVSQYDAGSAMATSSAFDLAIGAPPRNGSRPGRRGATVVFEEFLLTANICEDD